MRNWRSLAMSVLPLAVVLAGLVGTGACGPTAKEKKPGEVFRDDFNKFDPAQWWAVKGARAVEKGWLVLTSAPRQGAEVQSKRTFTHKVLEVKAASDKWSVDTSVAFENWEGPVHSMVGLTNGHLAVINQRRPKPNEHYARIPDWDTIKGKENVFRIVWQPKKVELYVNGKLSLTYEDPMVPDTKLKIRLNSSNDHKDRLRVDYVLVTELPKK